MKFNLTLCYFLLVLSTITFGDNSDEKGKEKPVPKSNENDNAKQESNNNNPKVLHCST